MATYKEKKKKLAQQRRVRKMEKELDLLATGAGMYWTDGYWEYQDDVERCLGNFMQAVSAQYSLPRTSFIFLFWNFKNWRTIKELAPRVLEAIEYKKQEQAREAD